jgi:arylsulfatase A-like enzyme
LTGELEFAYRSGWWKLMLDGNREPRELYNLQDDPLELFNEISAHPDVRQRLRRDFQAALTDIESN